MLYNHLSNEEFIRIMRDSPSYSTREAVERLSQAIDELQEEKERANKWETMADDLRYKLQAAESKLEQIGNILMRS